MHYEIITRPGELQAFKSWLPNLADDECYMLCLFARKKYAPAGSNIKADKCQLKRVTCTKETLVQKIEQMQVLMGNYSFDGIPVPQEALALYITVNPRSHSKAAKNLLVTLAQLITNPYNGYNPQALALTELQKAASRKPYFDIDIDGMTLDEVKPLLDGKINPSAVTILITRGGLHLLIEVAEISPKYQKTWYQELTTLPGVDVRGDNLIPVPGCYQGGWSPLLTSLYR